MSLKISTVSNYLRKKPIIASDLKVREISSSLLTISTLAMLALSSCSEEERGIEENSADNSSEKIDSLNHAEQYENIQYILMVLSGFLAVLSGVTIALANINRKNKAILLEILKSKTKATPAPESVEAYLIEMEEKISEVSQMWMKLYERHQKREKEINQSKAQMDEALAIAKGMKESAKQAEELALEYQKKSEMKNSEADQLLATAQEDRKQTTIRIAELLSQALEEARRTTEEARDKALALLRSTSDFVPSSPKTNSSTPSPFEKVENEKIDDTNPGIRILEEQLAELTRLGRTEDNKQSTNPITEEQQTSQKPAPQPQIFKNDEIPLQSPVPHKFERDNTPKSGVNFPPKDATRGSSFPPLGFSRTPQSVVKDSTPALAPNQEIKPTPAIPKQTLAPNQEIKPTPAPSRPSQELVAVDSALASGDFDLEALDGIFGGIGASAALGESDWVLGENTSETDDSTESPKIPENLA